MTNSWPCLGIRLPQLHLKCTKKNEILILCILTTVKVNCFSSQLLFTYTIIPRKHNIDFSSFRYNRPVQSSHLLAILMYFLATFPKRTALRTALPSLLLFYSGHYLSDPTDYCPEQHSGRKEREGRRDQGKKDERKGG